MGIMDNLNEIMKAYKDQKDFEREMDKYYFSDEVIGKLMNSFGIPFDVHDFNTSQFAYFEQAIKKGYDKEYLEILVNPQYDYRQMNMIMAGIDKGLSMEQLKLYADPVFNGKQMSQIAGGFEKGLSLEQVKKYAKPEMNDRLMNYFMRKELYKNSFFYKALSVIPGYKAIFNMNEKINDSLYTRLYKGHNSIS